MSARLARSAARLGVALGAVAALSTLAGCRSASAPGRPRGHAYDKSFESAGATVRLRVDRLEIAVADGVLVTLEATTGPGSTVRLPESPSGGERNSLELTDAGRATTRPLAGGSTRWTRWYRLEPFLSGEYVVAPFVVEVTDSKGARRALRTERVRVVVTSLLPKDYARLDIKDIAGLVHPPWRPPAWLLVTAGIVAAAGAGAALWLWHARRLLSRVEAPPRPLHEVAYESLDALVADDLIGRGRVKEFYRRVTGILRRYIEQRFGLRAPERTTEEFLRELRDTSVLSEELKKLLGAFLQHCDLVKFAEHRPLDEEIDRTLSSCREFVRATEVQPPEADNRGGPRAV